MPVDPNAVKALFLAALERQSPDARAAFLAEACAGNAGLRDRVEDLLRAHEGPGSFLELPAFAAAAGPGSTEAYSSRRTVPPNSSSAQPSRS